MSSQSGTIADEETVLSHFVTAKANEIAQQFEDLLYSVQFQRTVVIGSCALQASQSTTADSQVLGACTQLVLANASDCHM